MEPGWDFYRTLLAVLREGSLSAAARVLGLAQPTVGRHVEVLEQALGCALFTRSGHGLAPTKAALALRRDADIAVRMVRPVQEALVTRHLGDVEVGLQAHRSYLDRCGTPRGIDELPGHALIGFDTETAFIRRVSARHDFLQRKRFALRTDSDLAQLAAIRAGFGIGACQIGLARRDPALVRVLPEAFCVRLEVWLTMHEDLRASPRCRVSYDALAAGLCEYLGAPS